MRLLDTWTGQFVEQDPRNPETKYAILSHTWDPEGEQAHQDLRNIQRRHAPNCQRREGLHSAQDDPPSLGFVEPDRSGPSPLPCSASPVHDMSPTSHTSAQDTLSSAPSASQPPLIQSSMTPAVSSLGTHLEPPDTSLSPLWNDLELSPKIREACRVARENGHRYIWIDSCCIDKTSSSELSEAINSMYQWYAHAVVCFAFLADVPAGEDHKKKASRFRRSRWFTRGWTLQELIAPIYVRFVCKEWTFIGSKHTMADLVSEITGIGYNALLHVEPLRDFSIAQRLSWAAKRETTRVEDWAYSLLGIFYINMPTLYGEGQRAFRRLQEEILRRIPDQTLFAWSTFSLRFPTEHHEPRSAVFVHVLCSQDIPDSDHLSLLAPSPDFFSECGGLEPLPRDEVVRRLRHQLHLPAADYYSTPYGIRTQFPVIPFSAYFPASLVTDIRLHESAPFSLSQWYLAVLECEHKDYPGHLLGRVCYTQPSLFGIEFSYSGFVEIGIQTALCSPSRRYDLLPLSPSGLKRLRSSQIQINTVYVPHAEERDAPFEETRWIPHNTIKVVMLKKTRDHLRVKGYTVDLRGPDPEHPSTHSLILSHATHDIAIEVDLTLEGGPGDQKLSVSDRLRVSGKFWSSGSRTDSLPWSERVLCGDTGGDIPGVGRQTIEVELTLAAKGHYALDVEVKPRRRGPSSCTLIPATWRWRMRTCMGWLRGLMIRIGRAMSALVTREEQDIRYRSHGAPY